MKHHRPLDVTQAECHEIFDLRDGVLYYRNTGKLAGSICASGYWEVCINGKPHYKRGRIIWLMTHGADSYPLQIDHKNRNKSDDRPENLAAVTAGGNQRNKGPKAFPNKYLVKRGNGRILVRYKGKCHGSYLTVAEALAVLARVKEAA